MEFRGIGPSVPNHLRMVETVRPIEESGFSLLDFTPAAITICYFKWNQRTQSVEAIGALEPFHTRVEPRIDLIRLQPSGRGRSENGSNDKHGRAVMPN